MSDDSPTSIPDSFPPSDAPSFEAILGELEQLVARLEDGDLPLEESLAVFERGMKLSGQGNRILDAAEKRVEILLRARDGALEAAPFDEPRP